MLYGNTCRQDLGEYPSHALAKPEVFRRPWNSVVRPEKILTPGQKFVLVPHHAVRKLRRKIGKPTSNDASTDMVSRQNNNDVSSRSFFSESDISTGVSRDSSCSFRSALRKKTGHKGGHNSTNSEKKGNKVDHDTSLKSSSTTVSRSNRQ
ncbi:hypothetical protein NC651_007022 [Populus alba x Populus x berolinensis]|nr:hypothetical protein NC651_007022 [Populus alba x Populus x berolinensis]